MPQLQEDFLSEDDDFTTSEAFTATFSDDESLFSTALRHQLLQQILLEKRPDFRSQIEKPVEKGTYRSDYSHLNKNDCFPQTGVQPTLTPQSTPRPSIIRRISSEPETPKQSSVSPFTTIQDKDKTPVAESHTSSPQLASSDDANKAKSLLPPKSDHLQTTAASSSTPSSMPAQKVSFRLPDSYAETPPNVDDLEDQSSDATETGADVSELRSFAEESVDAKAPSDEVAQEQKNEEVIETQALYAPEISVPKFYTTPEVSMPKYDDTPEVAMPKAESVPEIGMPKADENTKATKEVIDTVLKSSMPECDATQIRFLQSANNIDITMANFDTEKKTFNDEQIVNTSKSLTEEQQEAPEVMISKLKDALSVCLELSKDISSTEQSASKSEGVKYMAESPDTKNQEYIELQESEIKQNLIPKSAIETSQQTPEFEYQTELESKNVYDKIAKLQHPIQQAASQESTIHDLSNKTLSSNEQSNDILFAVKSESTQENAAKPTSTDEPIKYTPSFSVIDSSKNFSKEENSPRTTLIPMKLQKLDRREQGTYAESDDEISEDSGRSPVAVGTQTSLALDPPRMLRKKAAEISTQTEEDHCLSVLGLNTSWCVDEGGLNTKLADSA